MVHATGYIMIVQMILFFFFLFSSGGDWNQGLISARLVLYNRLCTWPSFSIFYFETWSQIVYDKL